MDWSDATGLRPGDPVIASSIDGPLLLRVIDGPFDDGEFETMIVCTPADWALLARGGTPGDEWDEWRFHWPIEDLERPEPRGS